MFRRGINRRFPVLFFLPLFMLSACGGNVLGLSKREAAEMLKSGNIDFILNAELPSGFADSVSALGGLLDLDSGVPFYAALLADAKLDRREDYADYYKVTLLLCSALESPSSVVVEESALKLVPLVLENGAAHDVLAFLDSESMRAKNVPGFLRAACLYSLGRYGEAAESVSREILSAESGGWEKAFALFSAWKDPARAASGDFEKNEIIDFLFGPLPQALRVWAYGEAFKADGLLSAEESAILSVKLSPYNYGTNLEKLRPLLSDGGTAFFRHPEIISSLGSAYQYSGSLRGEGFSLFSSWINLLDEGGTFTLPPSVAEMNPAANPEKLEAFIKTLDAEKINEIKYLLFFYSGRIERAAENYAASSEYFQKAFRLAPDGNQEDACTWYVLMNTAAEDISSLAALVSGTMPRWNDHLYFEDVLERLSAYLAGNRQWGIIYDVFLDLEKHGAPLAQYAWILGRVVEEGYLEPERSARTFFRIALEEDDYYFYYKLMAASSLGENFTPVSEDADKENQTASDMDSLDFITGFFKYGASSFALPYIASMRGGLSISGLREIAGELAGASMWKESIDLVSFCMTRDDFELTSGDLFLLYPRPFRELTKKYSDEAEIGEELLYALIRTESYFMTDAVSRSGAVGLAQLMEPTARDMAERIARSGGPDYRAAEGIDLKNPEVSIHIGSYYLRYLVAQMGNPMLAILAYNGGMGRMRRWIASDRAAGELPPDLFLETIEYPETRGYGRHVLSAAAVYGYLY